MSLSIEAALEANRPTLPIPASNDPETETLRALIRSGVNLNESQDEYGCTHLHLAADQVMSYAKL